jgi:Leucine-rich repeat (LRR) protein
MRVNLIILSLMFSTVALCQGSLPYRDALSSARKADVTGLFISFESLTHSERSSLDLSSFPQLQSLEFLSGVPADVRLDSTQYERIIHLALNDCGLLELPRWAMRGDVIRFDRLTSLSVRVNSLQQLPICHLEDLKALDVSFNPGINVGCLRDASALTELFADGSGIDWCQLPVGLTHLSAKLQGNRIVLDDLSCLSTLAGLRSLDLSSNTISGKRLLHYLNSSCIDSLYLYNVNIRKRHRKAFNERSGMLVFYNEDSRTDKVHPQGSGSTIWRSSY